MSEGKTMIGRQWSRLPIMARAILGGVFVFMALQLGWNILLVANMSYLPHIPWAAPLTLLYLWVVFRYLNGHWGPRSTSETRRANMGARRLNRNEYLPAFGAGIAVLVFFVAFTMVSYRVIEVPADAGAMPDLPWWSLYSILLVISIVAGVSEEAGFRGYMQGPLEKRYGPVVAIGISAVMFWLAHLNHASGMARAIALIVMGGSLGALTWSARSILPALVTHATADATTFIGSTAGIGPDYLWAPTPLKDSGVDGFFWLMSAVVVVSGILSVVMLRKLAKVCRGIGQS